MNEIITDVSEAVVLTALSKLKRSRLTTKLTSVEQLVPELVLSQAFLRDQ